MPLVKASEWVAQNFADGSKPSTSTVARWIKQGVIRGRQIGKWLYVEENALERQPVGVRKPLITVPSSGYELRDPERD